MPALSYLFLLQRSMTHFGCTYAVAETISCKVTHFVIFPPHFFLSLVSRKKILANARTDEGREKISPKGKGRVVSVAQNPLPPSAAFSRLRRGHLLLLPYLWRWLRDRGRSWLAPLKEEEEEEEEEEGRPYQSHAGRGGNGMGGGGGGMCLELQQRLLG